MPPDLVEVLGQPDWVCFGLDRDRLLLHFARMDDASIEAMVFLGQRKLDSFATVAHSIDQVAAALPTVTHPDAPRFILHTAFCCSTLLARCIDFPGRVRTLRELPVLSGLAPLRMRLQGEGDAALWGRIVEIIDRLTSRPFVAGATTINKASNVFLPVAGDFLQRSADARALLIHSDLPGFLVSCVKKQSAGAGPWQAMLAALDPAGSSAAAHDIDVAQASPLELACTIWNEEMRILKSMRDQHARVRQVDAATFLAAPLATVRGAHAWFGVEVEDAARARIVEREMCRHAKQPDAAFDPTRRATEKALAERLFGVEIEQTLQWNDRRFAQWQQVYRDSISLFPALAV